MPYRENVELEQHIEGFNSAYERGDEVWFKYFDANATIYTIGSTVPFIGRAAYEDNFKNLLTKEQRQVEELKRDVQVMGNTAVVMQFQQITQSQVVTLLRQSTIWKQEGDTWRIIHMHCASAANPSPTAALKEPQAIRVLMGRIATVSAQVGVAQ
jgi:hypothetical protein